MRRYNQVNIGNAIVYECVRTAASIYPSPVLLEHCASVVSRFVSSTNHNLKYVGLDALSCIVNINPKYAAEHQMAGPQGRGPTPFVGRAKPPRQMRGVPRL